MESSQILIAGIGGLGCVWAARAHQRGAGASLLMLDADDRFPDIDGAHIIRLGRWWEGADTLGNEELALLKGITRVAVSQLTGGRAIRTREVFKDLKSLGKGA